MAQTYKQTVINGDSMTESVQTADAVEILNKCTKNYIVEILWTVKSAFIQNN